MKGGSSASRRQQYALDIPHPWQQSMLLGLRQTLRGPYNSPVIEQERRGFAFRGETHDAHTHTIFFQNDRVFVRVVEHFQIFYFLLRTPASSPWKELQLQDID